MQSYTIIADLHTHTNASAHAYSTVTENAAAAARHGMRVLGTTDHGPSIPDSPHMWHFGNLKVLPERIEGVRVLHGAEVNVLAGGALDMSDSVLSSLDVVVASMHSGVMPECGMEGCTAAWLAVAANPHIAIIGHSGSPEFAYDYERVIPEFGKRGKAVEINEHSYRARPTSAENCRKIAQICAKHRVPIVVDSDAHFHEYVGRHPRCLAMLGEINFPPELIVNGSMQHMAEFFGTRNVTI